MITNVVVSEPAPLPGPPTLNIKLPKRDSLKIKEKKATKKRPSLKSDRYLGGTVNEKLVKQRTSMESKKFMRKSTNPKTLKDELQKFSTSISNAIQQRRNTR